MLNEAVPGANASPNRDLTHTTVSRTASRNPWWWIPSLYFAEGLPNVLVGSVSMVIYKNLGLTNTDAAFYTSWLYLPWVVKPLWSPAVDLLRTRRWWIYCMQLVVAVGFASVALTIPTSWFLQLTIAGFWLVAFASATHDIAADGFYILGATEREQALFVGVRNTAFNIAKITAQGLLVAVAGKLKVRLGSFGAAWALVFGGVSVGYVALAAYHWAMLPKPAADQPGESRGPSGIGIGFVRTFASFFAKPRIAILLSFLLLYRFGEAQLLKIVQPFLIDARDHGGLGLSNEQFGVVYGTIGVVALVCGALLGGYLVSKHGLKRWLWPMVLVMHLPDLVFVYLALARPANLQVVGLCVAGEQFGYGFGFSAYMLYMIYIAQGEHQTAHYALCTGFMALGLLVPGMWSGWLQDHLGYPLFFLWVLLATIPGFVVTALIPLDPKFGKREM